MFLLTFRIVDHFIVIFIMKGGGDFIRCPYWHFGVGVIGYCCFITIFVRTGLSYLQS